MQHPYRQHRLIKNAAVGCHYTKKSWTHTLETKLGLETDSGDVINEVIKAVRKVSSSL